MPRNRKFFVVLLAFLSFLAMGAPIAAHAQTIDVTKPLSGSNGCSQATDMPTIIANGAIGKTAPTVTPGTPSATANPIDRAYQNAHAIVGQMVSKDITYAWSSLNKIDVASTYCVIKIITAVQAFVQSIQGLIDPFNIVMMLLTNEILALINNVCSQVLSAVTSLQNSLSALTRICVPLPNFGLNLNFGIKVPQCSGGTQIPLLSIASPGTANPVPYTYNNWFGNGSGGK